MITSTDTRIWGIIMMSPEVCRSAKDGDKQKKGTNNLDRSSGPEKEKTHEPQHQHRRHDRHAHGAKQPLDLPVLRRDVGLQILRAGDGPRLGMAHPPVIHQKEGASI